MTEKRIIRVSKNVLTPQMQLLHWPVTEPEPKDGDVEAENRKRLGSYYTPPFFARWVASELLKFVDCDHPISVLDPACGDGTLLAAVREQLGQSVRLIGRDIDPCAISAASTKLGKNAEIVLKDTLLDLNDAESVECQVDAIIANPPWGGQRSGSQEVMLRRGYTLARGQYDTYDLFVERAVKCSREGTVAAFILPESILMPQHEPLRKLLLEESEILMIARLGEGLFKGVYRDTIVVIFRNGRPSLDHQIKCFQLSPQLKPLVHRQVITLAEAAEQCIHQVPQKHFSQDPHHEFKIGMRMGEEAPRKAADIPSFAWDKWVKTRRGVEIGKQGKVLYCEKCDFYRPDSADPHSKCSRCAGTVRRATIVAATRPGSTGTSSCKWSPLIVGEDVQRYSCAPSRYIKHGACGVKYNDVSHYAHRKLLIRKTGVGLRCAIDETGCLTTQTVFNVFCPHNSDLWILDYLQGVLNSRALLAIHLRRTGDIQWRSHPYVTPMTIRSLPIPEPSISIATTSLAKSIAEISAKFRVNGDPGHDLALEDLVCRLLNFDQADRHWISSVIDETSHLKYFDSLRQPISTGSPTNS